MEFLVVNLIGEKIYISLERENSIWDLKDEISKYFLNISPCEQKLIFKDCFLSPLNKDHTTNDTKLHEIEGNPGQIITVHLVRQRVPAGQNIKPASMK